jgi:hypothetical protein
MKTEAKTEVMLPPVKKFQGYQKPVEARKDSLLVLSKEVWPS